MPTGQVPERVGHSRVAAPGENQPDVVAEMKMTNAMRKIVSDSLCDKLTPWQCGKLRAMQAYLRVCSFPPVYGLKS